MARTAEEIAQNIAERQQRAAERAAQAQQRAEERAQRNEERAAKARDKNAERDLDRALKTFGAAAPIVDMVGRGVGALTGFRGTVDAADGVYWPQLHHHTVCRVRDGAPARCVLRHRRRRALD